MIESGGTSSDAVGAWIEAWQPEDAPLLAARQRAAEVGVGAVDPATGQSVVSPDRPDRLKSEVVVRNIPPGAFTDGRQPGWYVAEVTQRGESF